MHATKISRGIKLRLHSFPTPELDKGKIVFMCGNKMPTRCNRSFYCRSYCLLNMWSTTVIHFWCDFDRASSLICGNKMPARFNRGFYCRSYCLLNMFRVPLCPSSGAQEYIQWLLRVVFFAVVFQVAGLVWSWGLCVQFAGCWLSKQ